jgi:hypothetical protein
MLQGRLDCNCGRVRLELLCLLSPAVARLSCPCRLLLQLIPLLLPPPSRNLLRLQLLLLELPLARCRDASSVAWPLRPPRPPMLLFLLLSACCILTPRCTS